MTSHFRTLYRNQNSIVSYSDAVVSYSVTLYQNLNDIVSHPVSLYRNLNDVVSYLVTIDCIQKIVMSYTADVYYSRYAVTS